MIQTLIRGKLGKLLAKRRKNGIIVLARLTPKLYH
jgi:hypothetical protein